MEKYIFSPCNGSFQEIFLKNMALRRNPSNTPDMLMAAMTPATFKVIDWAPSPEKDSWTGLGLTRKEQLRSSRNFVKRANASHCTSIRYRMLYAPKFCGKIQRVTNLDGRPIPVKFIIAMQTRRLSHLNLCHCSTDHHYNFSQVPSLPIFPFELLLI